MKRIYVDDFIRDKKCAAQGIEAALYYAGENNIGEVVFGEGVYNLTNFYTIDTPSIAHDDGCGDIRQKDCHVVLEGLKNIVIKGAECGEGEPKTIIAGYNSRVSQTLLPSIFWVKDCHGITLKDLAFTRDPETASAGIVTKVEENGFEVEVFEGLPCYDNMAAYCMNRFCLKDNSLLGASLTYGFGFDKSFTKIGERTLRLEDCSIAAAVSVGDGLSWHQSGKTDFQLFFGGCKDLRLENIRIYNTNSFGILTENCKNISAYRLVIKPRGKQLFSGSRDGWKIYRCSGSINLIDCHFEGVRMDGQNVHSNFMKVKEVLSPKSVLADCKYAAIPLENDSIMEFYNGKEMTENKITTWEVAGSCAKQSEQSKDSSATTAVVGTTNIITTYKITFEDPLKSFVVAGALITPQCWEPSSYWCKSTTFRNIAGAGHLLRCGEAVIEECTYGNMMNGGILVGAELDTHSEGGHGVNIKVIGCTFDNCGFKARYVEFAMGCIAIKSQGFSLPLNKNIEIVNNSFRNSKVAMEVRDASGVKILGNAYEGIEEKLIIDEKSTEDIFVLE